MLTAVLFMMAGARAQTELLVVGNRGDGTLSVIDPATDTVVNTVVMPDAGEPMYINALVRRNRVFVGDRANDRVVVFRADDFTVETTVPAGEGVFHSWIDPMEDQMWVVNDTDATVTVIDTEALSVIGTIAMPADLVALGLVPHDVTIDSRRNNRDAFVTMSAAGQDGYVLKYDTSTLLEVARAAVGNDPHLSLLNASPDVLYVMSGGTGEVTPLARADLAVLAASLAVPTAHGSVLNRNNNSDYFYTTNIGGAGIGGLVVIDPVTFTVVAEIDTPYPAPHNMSFGAGRKLYITHSDHAAGNGTEVSVWDLTLQEAPVALTKIIVGLNPFGIARLPDAPPHW